MLPDLSVGTGFFVSNDLLGTAAHVVAAMEKSRKEYPDGYVFMVAEKYDEAGQKVFSRNVEVVTVDDAQDVALLRLSNESKGEDIRLLEIKPLKVLGELPKVGDEVVHTGFSNLSLKPFTTIGTVAVITNEQDGENARGTKDSIYSDLTTLPGNSGGPLLSAKYGHVIGIQTATVTSDSARIRFGVAAKSKVLIEILRQYDAQLKKQNSNTLQ